MKSRACTQLDANLPTPLVGEISITVFVDSDHGHDKVTRISIRGMIAYIRDAIDRKSVAYVAIVEHT